MSKFLKPVRLIHDSLMHAADERSEKTALIIGKKRHSYRDLWRKAVSLVCLGNPPATRLCENAWLSNRQETQITPKCHTFSHSLVAGGFFT